jgi:hypothetical protein
VCPYIGFHRSVVAVWLPYHSDVGGEHQWVLHQLLGQFAAAWNAHDPEALPSMVTEECAFETAAGVYPYGNRFTGKEALRAAFPIAWKIWPNAGWAVGRNTTHFVCGTRGISEWTFRSIDGDGRVTEVRGVDLFVLRDGKRARSARTGSTAVTLFAKADDWFARLTSGEAGGIRSIAQQEKVSSSYVVRVVQLAFLAPGAIAQRDQFTHADCPSLDRERTAAAGLERPASAIRIRWLGGDTRHASAKRCSFAAPHSTTRGVSSISVRRKTRTIAD